MPEHVAMSINIAMPQVGNTADQSRRDVVVA